jgi:hypothetical protein
VTYQEVLPLAQRMASSCRWIEFLLPFF